MHMGKGIESKQLVALQFAKNILAFHIHKKVKCIFLYQRLYTENAINIINTSCMFVYHQYKQKKLSSCIFMLFYIYHHL